MNATEFVRAGLPWMLVILACSKRKNPTATRVRDLYTGQLHAMGRAIAEQVEEQGGRWYVLSGLYGALAPDEVGEVYDHAVPRSGVERDRWALAVQSRIRRDLELVPPTQRGPALVLAGERYTRGLALPALIESAWGVETHTPLRGMGIGRQLHHLKQALIARGLEAR